MKAKVVNTERRILAAPDWRTFMFTGRAVFGVTSKKTGKRLVFRFTRAKKLNAEGKSTFWATVLLSGKFQYVGWATVGAPEERVTYTPASDALDQDEIVANGAMRFLIEEGLNSIVGADKLEVDAVVESLAMIPTRAKGGLNARVVTLNEGDALDDVVHAVTPPFKRPPPVQTTATQELDADTVGIDDIWGSWRNNSATN
jgi:hypothetical protein